MRWILVVAVGCGRLDFDPLTSAGSDAPVSCDPCLGGPVTVLDDFNRPDGPIGGSWVGDTGSFVIASGTLEADSSGAIELPMIEPAGGSWVDVVLARPVLDQEIGLVVQAQGVGGGGMRIEGNYHEQSNAPGSHVHVSVDPGGAFTTQNIELQPGDHLRVVDHDGSVSIYANGVLVHAADAIGWSFPTSPGPIGISASFVNPGFRIDDFTAAHAVAHEGKLGR